MTNKLGRAWRDLACIWTLSENLVTSETIYNPKISRFAKESEMCFILAYKYESVSNFLNSVLKENKVSKACSLYIKFL